MAPTRAVLWTTAVLALGAGAVVAALVLTGYSDEAVPLALLGLVSGWSFVGSGLVAWARRPENRIGPMLILAGFTWFLAGLQFSDISAVFTAGALRENVFIVVVAWLLLAFPNGDLGRSRLCRTMVVVGFIDVIGVAAVHMSFDDFGGGSPGAEGPQNLLLVGADDTFAAIALGVQRGVGITLSVLTIVIVVYRWLTASPPMRRAIATVLAAGAATFAALAVSSANDATGQPLGELQPFVWLVFATVPWAFLAGLMRVRLARTAVAELVVELGAPDAQGGLRGALARALDDPSLEVAYWLPGHERYVDVDGRAFELPVESEERTVTFVEREGRRIAALIHDPALREDHGLLDSVCAAAALALENARLQADLKARLEELRASRARIVEAAEAERQRIERNLHDGTQQRLVSIAMTLGLAESKLAGDRETVGPIVDEAREALAAALEELRELSRGIHPGILRERGLRPALRQLAYRAGVPVELDVVFDDRLPEQTEATAYYVVSESLANVAKYAHATAVRVKVGQTDGRAIVEVADDGVGGADGTRGTGLRGLRDRVEAIGGQFSLASPPGRGTIVRAEIPCA
jgi:signal transduction histidine kinase